jgi:hypothetical protein
MIYNRNRLIIDPSITYDVLKHKVKTGDIILGKSNSYYSTLFVSYFTHAGLILILNEQPYVIEANGIQERIDNANNVIKYIGQAVTIDFTKHIWMTPLNDWVEKYYGSCYYMELKNNLTKEQSNTLHDYVMDLFKNYQYDFDVLSNLARIFGLNTITDKLLCSELVLLCFVKLGLLNKWTLHGNTIVTVANLDTHYQPKYIY